MTSILLMALLYMAESAKSSYNAQIMQHCMGNIAEMLGTKAEKVGIGTKLPQSLT